MGKKLGPRAYLVTHRAGVLPAVFVLSVQPRQAEYHASIHYGAKGDFFAFVATRAPEKDGMAGSDGAPLLPGVCIPAPR